MWVRKEARDKCQSRGGGEFISRFWHGRGEAVKHLQSPNCTGWSLEQSGEAPALLEKKVAECRAPMALADESWVLGRPCCETVSRPVATTSAPLPAGGMGVGTHFRGAVDCAIAVRIINSSLHLCSSGTASTMYVSHDPPSKGTTGSTSSTHVSPSLVGEDQMAENHRPLTELKPTTHRLHGYSTQPTRRHEDHETHRLFRIAGPDSML